MTKRVLSVFLSLAMILSLMVIPVSAEGGVPTITLSTVSFTADGATFTESSTINEAKPGDLIAVKVYFDNHSSNSMYIKSLDLTIEYDGNVFEPYTYSYKEGRDTITKGPVVVTDLSRFSIQSNKLNNRNAVKLSGAYANGLAIDSSSGEYHDAVLGYYMFKVISDVETNTATFKINGDDDNVKASSTQEETSTAEIEGLTFDSTASIKINGVTPEINAVNLYNANVTADGSSPVTVKATATSKKGTDLTNAVMWSVVNENGAGVSIAPNGTITVAKDAMAGDYTIKAAGKTIFSGGGNNTGAPVTGTKKELSTGNATATLKVQRNESQITSVEISGVQDVTIPDNNKNAEIQPEAIVKDQYGDTMSEQTVSWSLDASDVSGVSIDRNTGKVTVTNAAKDSIQNNQTFTVKATCGGKSESKTFQVKRADAVTTSITLSDVSNMIVPADETNATEDVTATVKDQYDTPISNPTVAWSIAPKVTGVSIDNNGKITVTNAAKAGIADTTGKEFTVTATSGTAKAEKKFHIKRDTQTAKALVICKNGVELSGDTDTVIIPTTDTANDYTYTVKISDQYGAKMTADSTVTISAIGDASADAISGNKLTIRKTATKEKQYKVTATCGALTKEVTVTVKDIDITWPTATVAQSPVYGAFWKDIVTGFTGGNATLNSETVNGQFTLKTPNEIPNAGNQTYVVNFTGTLNGVSYNIDKTYDAVQIAQKSVTITGLSASNKEYDGNNVATPTGRATISGKLAKDELTVTAGTASFADKNVGTNKTVTFTGYALSGAAAGNYELSAQPVTVKANITQKEITVGAGNLHFTKVYDGTTSVSTSTGTLVLNGVITGDVVSVKTDYTAAYEDVNAGDAKKVTLSGLTLDGADAGNYKLNATTLEITGNAITKAVWTKTAATSQAKYGTTGTLDLSPYLASDATIGQITATDTNGILVGNPSVTDQTLSYQFKNDASLKDKTAEIKIHVTSNNYDAYDITVTVTVLDKLTQNDFKFAAAAQTKTYGDSKFTYVATGAVNGSAVTYSSGNTDVATVNKTTGEVTILKAGETTITAAATATDDYAAATQTYTLTVNKAKLTVRPKSYTIRVGDTLPTPEVEYVGLKNNDKAENVAKLNEGKKLDLKIKNKDNGTLENSNTTGTYEIVFKEKPAFQTTDNYDIEVVDTGKLTINSRSSGSSGGSGVSTYPVSVTTPKNGKVTVSPSNAAKGAAVTVTVTPDSGYEMDKLTVTDASGKTISTTDKGNGKFTFTMPNGKVSVSATFKQTTVTPPSTGFMDVPASAYYADAVKWAVEKGITTGTSATTFSPEASCTRAQMVTFLWRAAGSPAPKATTTAFTDLDKSAYYYDAVLWAVEQGITTGTSATTFSPNATVTRGQTVTFLYRFAGQPAVSGSSSFTDVNSSDYYAAAVQWAKEQGITSGTSDTTFSPTSDCTRGQIVTFLYRQLAK